jgi:hypothetical protein
MPGRSGIRARFAGLKLSTKVLLMGAILTLGFPIPLMTWLLPAQRNNSYQNEVG